MRADRILFHYAHTEHTDGNLCIYSITSITGMDKNMDVLLHNPEGSVSRPLRQNLKLEAAVAFLFWRFLGRYRVLFACGFSGLGLYLRCEFKDLRRGQGIASLLAHLWLLQHLILTAIIFPVLPLIRTLPFVWRQEASMSSQTKTWSAPGLFSPFSFKSHQRDCLSGSDCISSWHSASTKVSDCISPPQPEITRSRWEDNKSGWSQSDYEVILTEWSYGWKMIVNLYRSMFFFLYHTNTSVMQFPFNFILIRLFSIYYLKIVNKMACSITEWTPIQYTA